MKRQSNKDRETVIVIGEELAKPFPMTQLDREKGRIKEGEKDHYYL